MDICLLLVDVLVRWMDICLLLVHVLMNGIHLPLVHVLISIWIYLLFVHVLGTDYIHATCARYAILCVCHLCTPC